MAMTALSVVGRMCRRTLIDHPCGQATVNVSQARPVANVEWEASRPRQPLTVLVHIGRGELCVMGSDCPTVCRRAVQPAAMRLRPSERPVCNPA